jgi:transcriptional regulator with XRE-family HTH domain
MINIIESASKNIALNIFSLRHRKGLSQLQLSKLTGLTRASIAQFESGISNPSLESLLKLSQGFQISIDELISGPRSECKHIKAEDVLVEKKSRPGITIRKLLPDKNPSTDIEELSLESGRSFNGTPHTEGTREYFTCVKGEFQIVVLGTTFVVKKGDVLSFPGNKPHSYKNMGNTSAQGISVILFSAGQA